MVTWSTSIPCSASSSSTSRKESPYRRYHRTAKTMISGGHRNPTNAELGTTGIGRKRRGIIPPRSPTGATLRQCNRAYGRIKLMVRRGNLAEVEQGFLVIPGQGLPGIHVPDPNDPE